MEPLRRREMLAAGCAALLGGLLCNADTVVRRVAPCVVGTWNTIAGQLTDDSEMALLLARMLADQGR